jgi:hypothetical protein
MPSQDIILTFLEPLLNLKIERSGGLPHCDYFFYFSGFPSECSFSSRVDYG